MPHPAAFTTVTQIQQTVAIQQTVLACVMSAFQALMMPAIAQPKYYMMLDGSFHY
jgi:hypothetical protein